MRAFRSSVQSCIMPSVTRALLALIASVLGLAASPAEALPQNEESPVSLTDQQIGLLRLAPDAPAPSRAIRVDTPGPVHVTLRSEVGGLIWAIVPPAPSGLPTLTAANVAAQPGGSFALLTAGPAGPNPTGGIVIRRKRSWTGCGRRMANWARRPHGVKAEVRRGPS